MCSFAIVPSLAALLFSTTTYYASPNGSGDGTAVSQTFTIDKFWAVAKPGTTLILLDGQYKTPVNPPGTVDGERGNPITIKAQHDGEVLIDGEFKRTPILLNGNDYLVIEGINARNGNNAVVQIRHGTYNQIKRVCAWEATSPADPNGNTEIFGVHDNSSNNLFEDCAGWGRCRKVFQNSYGGDNTTYRRCFAKWTTNNFTANSGGEMCYSLAYNSRGNIIENCIGTWDGACPNPRAIFSNDGSPNTQTGFKLLGSLAYVKATDTFPAAMLFHSIYLDDVEFKDVIGVIEGWRGTLKNVFRCGGDIPDAENAVASNLTAICKPVSPDPIYPHIIYFRHDWKVSNAVWAEKINVENNPFSGTTGARFCYRYINGKLTTQKLWPWPMNERIKRASGIDVMADIEHLLGKIPAACRTE